MKPNQWREKETSGHTYSTSKLAIVPSEDGIAP